MMIIFKYHHAIIWPILFFKFHLYRVTPALVDPFFAILDSLKADAGIDSEEYVNLEKSQKLAFGKIANEIAIKREKYSKKVTDSLWTLQEELDRKNIHQLIDIITEADGVTLDTLDCLKRSLSVFVHTPDELKKKVRKVVKERQNYISKNRYRHIMWHLDGRKGKEIQD